MPTVANVVAQIAISGATKNGVTSAPEDLVVNDMIELGLSESEVLEIVQRTVKLGVAAREAGKLVLLK